MRGKYTSLSQVGHAKMAPSPPLDDDAIVAEMESALMGSSSGGFGRFTAVTGVGTWTCERWRGSRG